MAHELGVEGHATHPTPRIEHILLDRETYVGNLLISQVETRQAKELDYRVCVVPGRVFVHKPREYRQTEALIVVSDQDELGSVYGRGVIAVDTFCEQDEKAEPCDKWHYNPQEDEKYFFVVEEHFLVVLVGCVEA